MPARGFTGRCRLKTDRRPAEIGPPCVMNVPGNCLQGSEPGFFDLPHDVLVDSQGRMVCQSLRDVVGQGTFRKSRRFIPRIGRGISGKTVGALPSGQSCIGGSLSE